MKSFVRFLLFIAFSVLLFASLHLRPPAPQPASAPAQTVNAAVNSYDRLNSIEWMQSSAEYRAACEQAYRLAALELNAALRSPDWTAATEQKAPFPKLPPAIIFDIDETIFDNSPYNGAMLKAGRDYDEKSWAQWGQAGQVQPIPGALEFAKSAARKGVAIFYVSNRGAGEEAATIQNIHRLGFPIESRYHLMLKGEQPAWSADKTFRRAFVARGHRVLLLLGDDLNDFVSTPKMSPAQRQELRARYRKNWGEKWIIIPNPTYGSWEIALLGNPKLSGPQKLQRKLQTLKIFAPSLAAH